MSNTQKKRPLARTVVEASVVLTLLSGIAVLLRLASVARGNLDLAFSIAKVSNFGEILLSTLLLAAPALSALAILVVEMYAVPKVTRWAMKPDLKRARPAIRAGVLISLTIGIGVIFQTKSGVVVLLVVMGGLAAVLVFATIRWNRIRSALLSLLAPSGRRSENSFMTRYVVIPATIVATLGTSVGGVAVVLQWIIPSDQAWSSSEALYFSDREPYVARVLSSDETWTYLLDDNYHRLDIVSTPDLLQRSICDAEGLAADVSEKLWLANTFGRVPLYVTSCDDKLVEYKEFYDDHHDDVE